MNQVKGDAMEMRINGVPVEALDYQINFTPNVAKPYGDLPIRLEPMEVTCTGTFWMSPEWAEEIRVGLWRRHREGVIVLWLRHTAHQN